MSANSGLSRTAADVILITVCALNGCLIEHSRRNFIARVRLLRRKADRGNYRAGKPPLFPWIRTCEFVQLLAVCTHFVTVLVRTSTRLWTGLSPSLCSSLLLMADSLVIVYQPCTTAVLIVRATGVLPRRRQWPWSSTSLPGLKLAKRFRLSTWSPRSCMRWLLATLCFLGWVFWVLAAWEIQFNPSPEKLPTLEQLDGISCIHNIDRQLLGPASALHLSVYVLVAATFSIPLSRHLFFPSTPSLGTKEPDQAHHAIRQSSRSAKAVHASISQVFWSVITRTLLAVLIHLGVTIAEFVGVFSSGVHGIYVQYSLSNIASLTAASFAAPKRKNMISNAPAPKKNVGTMGTLVLRSKSTPANEANAAASPGTISRRPSGNNSAASSATSDAAGLFVITNDPLKADSTRRGSFVGPSASAYRAPQWLPGNGSDVQTPVRVFGPPSRSPSVNASDGGNQDSSDAGYSHTHADLISTEFKVSGESRTER